MEETRGTKSLPVGGVAMIATAIGAVAVAHLRSAHSRLGDWQFAASPSSVLN